MIKAWRKLPSLPSSSRRLLPFLAFSLLLSIGFGAADVFSARISSAMGNEVLLTGNRSALVDFEYNNVSDQDIASIYFAYSSQIARTSFEYADRCFGSNLVSKSGSIPDSCSTFVKASFPINVTLTTSCPFEDKICRSTSQKNISNMILDTGILDSHNDFGMNSSPEERISIRQVFHCAPLALDGYTKVSKDETVPGLNNTAQRYYENRSMLQFFYGKCWPNQTDDLTYQ